MLDVKLKKFLKAKEKRFICETLALLDWNKPKTAKALGISVSSLYRKIDELGIRKSLRRIPQTKGEIK